MIYADIIALLTANDFGTFGEDLWWGNMPHTPDEVLVGFETPGPAGLYTKSGRAREEARIQFLARAPDYADAMSKALAVYDFFDGKRWTADGVTYFARAIQRPFDVGSLDGTDRTIISCNYALTLMEA